MVVDKMKSKLKVKDLQLSHLKDLYEILQDAFDEYAFRGISDEKKEELMEALYWAYCRCQ